MRRDELRGLWSIQPIANLPSVAAHGILCHNLAAQMPHVDVSMPEVQDIRRTKRVPDARIPSTDWKPLHDYANLYICPRNPMLYKRLGQKDELAVLRISVDVLDLPGVVVTDGNAAGGPTRFDEPTTGIERIDYAVTFAVWWTHADPYEKAEHRRRMCAEVLVPSRAPASFIDRIYVCGPASQAACGGLPWPIEINKYTFFA